MNTVQMPKPIISIVIICFNYRQVPEEIEHFSLGTQTITMIPTVSSQLISKFERKTMIYILLFVKYRNLQHERQKQQKKQFVENIQSKIHYQEKPDVEKVERVAQTDHQIDRVVYLDEPVPKISNIATKALVRNLNSSSVQEHMVWDTESTCSQRTNSDLFVFLNRFFLS